jgi:hypothetical protein
MPAGLQKTVRRALLTRLKNNAGMIAAVPATSINPLGEPVWPFIVLRSPVTQPKRVSSVLGGAVSWDIHAFAGPRMSGASMVETAEDHAGRIGALIEAVFADNRISLEGGLIAKITLTDIRLLPDQSPDVYHWFAQVNAKVLAP